MGTLLAAAPTVQLQPAQSRKQTWGRCPVELEAIGLGSVLSLRAPCIQLETAGLAHVFASWC